MSVAYAGLKGSVILLVLNELGTENRDLSKLDEHFIVSVCPWNAAAHMTVYRSLLKKKSHVFLTPG